MDSGRKKIALVIYGDPDQLSGGYAYDRALMAYLQEYGFHCSFLDFYQEEDRKRFRHFDILIIDGLCHSSFRRYYHELAGMPSIALIHHLQSSEREFRFFKSSIRASERYFLKTVDDIICTNTVVLEEAEGLRGRPFRHAVIAPPGRAKLLPLGSETENLPGYGEKLRLLFVGNIIPRKGLSVLVRALGQGSLRESPWELGIYGSKNWKPSYADALLKRIEKKGLPVRYHGQVSTEDLHEAYAAADILIVPSSYEGFGMVYLEAMLHSTVVMASAHGGAASFIEDGVNGFLIRHGDYRRIADILVRLHQDRALMGKIRKRAYRSAGRMPDWEESMKRVAVFLEDEGL